MQDHRQIRWSCTRPIRAHTGSRLNGEPSRTGSDRGIYSCDVIESYKGNVPDSIRVLLFYDSVEEGSEYYLFLTKNDKSDIVKRVLEINAVNIQQGQYVLPLIEHRLKFIADHP